MKKLSKAQRAELAELHEAVESAANALNHARDAFEVFREDIASQQQEYISERSERWTESEAGEQYEQWAQAWEEELCDEAQLNAEDVDAYPSSPGDA